MMRDLSEQTAIIVEHLLEQDPGNQLETDSDSSEDEEILKVARCLRKVGDEYNVVLHQYIEKLQPNLHELVKDKTCKVFSKMVTDLWNNPEVQTHLDQLGSEMNLLRIAVVLGIHISKEAPELLPMVKDAMVNFINTKLGTWIQYSGGWGKLL